MQNIIALLIVIAVTIGGIVSAMTQGGGMFKDNTVISQVTDLSALMTGARQGLGTQPGRYTNFNNGNVAGLIVAGILPKNMVNNNVVQNRWGGGVTLSSGPNQGQGVISTTWPDPEVCTKIATTIGNYDTLQIGNAVYTSNTRPDAVTAAGACSNSQTMTITFST